MREAVGICVVVGPGLIDMSVAGDVSTKSAEISACVYQEHSCGCVYGWSFMEKSE